MTLARTYARTHTDWSGEQHELATRRRIDRWQPAEFSLTSIAPKTRSRQLNVKVSTRMVSSASPGLTANRFRGRLVVDPATTRSCVARRRNQDQAAKNNKRSANNRRTWASHEQLENQHGRVDAALDSASDDDNEARCWRPARREWRLDWSDDAEHGPKTAYCCRVLRRPFGSSTAARRRHGRALRHRCRATAA